MRGAVGEVVGLVGGVIWSWTKSCLAFVGLASLTESDLRSGFGSDQSLGSGGGGGGGSKKHRRKQSSQSHSGDSQQQRAGSSSDGDKSVDFMSGKLTFRLFPDAIRSQALHVQQMRTSDMYRALERVWEASPSAQLLVAMAATTFLICGWLFSLGGYVWLVGNASGTSGQDYQTVESSIPNFGEVKAGGQNVQDSGGWGQNAHYWRNQSPFPAPAMFDVQPPNFVCLMFLIISFGTAASLILYGRVMLPIPEFVAGTNVLKAIRAETRILGGGSAGGSGKSSKSRDKELPWAENYKSITTENRLRLYYKVALVRLVENIFLCAVLPQTEIVCRYTGHCEPGPVLWGPTGVSGMFGRRFGKGHNSLLTSSYDALVGDDFATRLIITTTVVLTGLLLIAQMGLMNRTYFAIMGYISGEWELVTETGDENDDEQSVSQSRFWPKSWLYDVLGIGSKPIQSYSTRRSNTLMQWDPKRRYQKGDRIAYDDAVYEAVSNSPEGPPFDPFLRAAHDLFDEELGHPSSSAMMPILSMGTIVMASMLLGCMLIWRNAGWNYYPLLLCLTASLIGGYVVAHSTERSIHGMKAIAEEIAKQTK